MIPGNKMINSSQIFLHIVCRNSIYPTLRIQRFPVPDEKTPWDSAYPNYDPPFIESESLSGKPWADPPIVSANTSNFQPKWNEENGSISRKSHIGRYSIENGYPLNPFGRTGIKGRGLLGRWGPNHAADPIVTRWKRDNRTMEIINDLKTGRGILQMVTIQRRDNNMWAIPGGMVDPGEKVSITVKREFMEEALNGNASTESLDNFFMNGQETYTGYVDDPRNTDNAWMETVAYNFHDDSGNIVGGLQLIAGDDAGSVKWIDLREDINLYASHKLIIENVVKKLNGHW